MEAVFRHSSADFKNHRNIHPRFMSQPTENFVPSSSSFHGGVGLLYTPPFSFSPSLLNPRHHHYHQQQPPLLPLPIPNSYQNTRRINNRSRHQSLSVKKSNPSTASPKREKSKHESMKVSSDSVIISSINSRLGPDPKYVPRVLFSGNSNTVSNDDQVAKFSGSVVPSTVLSPPPSSLPLPTFSLRPKLSCNAEAAAGVDAGATDNLRRMLRLR